MELDAAETDEMPEGTLWLNPITREVSPVEAVKPAKKRPRDEKGRLLPAAAPDEPTPNL